MCASLIQTAKPRGGYERLLALKHLTRFAVTSASAYAPMALQHEALTAQTSTSFSARPVLSVSLWPKRSAHGTETVTPKVAFSSCLGRARQTRSVVMTSSVLASEMVLAPVGSSVRPTTRHTAVPVMTHTGCATANVDLAQTATPTVGSSLNPRLLHLMLNAGAKNFAVASLEKVRLAEVVQLTTWSTVSPVCPSMFSRAASAFSHQRRRQR